MSGTIMPAGAAGLLEAACYVAVCLQLVHAASAVAMLPRGRRARQAAYGAAVALHLCLAADLLAALAWEPGLPLAAALDGAGWLAALWTDGAFAAVAAACSPYHGPRRWMPAAAMLACLPPVARACGPWWDILLSCEIAGFLVARAWALVMDWRARQEAPSALSIAEAMNVIGVGMLATNGAGGSTFMNAAMRSQLEELGLPTDLGDLSSAWELAATHEVGLPDLGISEGVHLPFGTGTDRSDQMLLGMDGGHVLLATIDPPVPGRPGTRAFSVDVTEIVRAARELSDANVRLGRANAELAAQLADVQDVARQAAFLRMRSAVHDVIGQRLSILQRYLEEGGTGPASVARLEALMGSVLDDLRGSGPSAGGPPSELRELASAFSLVDVAIKVDGELPADRAAAEACLRTIREASTNACRHAHARTVFVRLRERGGVGRRWTLLEIRDDGRPDGMAADGRADGHGARRGGASSGGVAPREGTGIPGMRRAVEELGGIFLVRMGPPFTISARIPWGMSDGMDAADAARGDGPRFEAAEGASTEEGGA